MVKTARIWGVFVAGFVMMATAAGAQEGSSVPGKLTMGAEFSYFKYEEPDVMEETGPLFGVYGEYVLRTPENDRVSSWEEFLAGYQNNYIFGIDAQFLAGQVDYESQSTGSIDDINDYIFEIRGVAGYDFPIFEQTVWTPYFGIGYRYLNDDTGGKTSTTGAAGYERESNYVYIPIGLKTNTPLSELWQLGFNVEYDIFVQGTQKSHLEDVSPALNTVKNDQEDGYGVRGSVQFARQAQTWNLLVEPFIRYWDVDESSVAVITCGGTPCAAGYEPKNESLEYGVKVGTQF